MHGNEKRLFDKRALNSFGSHEEKEGGGGGGEGGGTRFKIGEFQEGAKPLRR